jgi:hypothetical protein
VEYIKITASYSGTPADIYIGSISMFMGSYGESQTNSNTGVTTPGYALGVNDGHNAVLQATSANPTAWIQIGFGTLYSGDLLLRGYLSSGSNSSVTVEVSSTGAPGSFEPVPNACNWKGSATWVDCSGISQALYVLIEVSYGHPGNAELYLDAVYIA